MLSLDVATAWTRILSVTAGAAAAAGAPGPGTLVDGAPALGHARGPWLGLLDLQGLNRDECAAIRPWLARRAGPLLLVRHLLLAQPLDDELFIELAPATLAALPPGWRDGPQPILILCPAGRAGPARRRHYVDALSRLRVPLTSAGSDLWAIREYDPALLAAVAALADSGTRDAFRAAIDPSQARLFDEQLPAAEAALLDDLVGARDEEGPLAQDTAGLHALYPQTHALAAFGAVERAHNQRRPAAERTFFSGRTIEARLTGRGYPLAPQPCSVEFAEQAAPLALLPDELQRLSEAKDLLDRA